MTAGYIVAELEWDLWPDGKPRACRLGRQIGIEASNHESAGIAARFMGYRAGLVMALESRFRPADHAKALADLRAPLRFPKAKALEVVE
jgi:hypothetical protein